MHSKAQVSAEFFVFLGLAFLVAIAFELASLDQLNDFRVQRESDAVKDLAFKLQKEALIAANVEDGYARAFEIPQKLESANYTVSTKNNTVIVESKNAFYILSIPRAVGNFTIGTNRMNKTGGVVYIN